jgi:hypothetical protein
MCRVKLTHFQQPAYPLGATSYSTTGDGSNKIYRPPYQAGDTDQRSSTSDSIFSERYASQNRPSNAGKVMLRNEDSFEEGRSSPALKQDAKHLTAVDEASDVDEWSTVEVDEWSVWHLVDVWL